MLKGERISKSLAPALRLGVYRPILAGFISAARSHPRAPELVQQVPSAPRTTEVTAILAPQTHRIEEIPPLPKIPRRRCAGTAEIPNTTPLGVVGRRLS